MLVTTIISYASSIFGVCFMILCLACGLYYLAEVADENSQTVKTILKTAIYVVAGVHIALAIFEDFPLWLVAFSFVSNGAYYLLMDSFPNIQLTSPRLILSCVMLIIDHSLWFRYFLPTRYQFYNVLGVFLICVWLVPFSLFVTLSANDATPAYSSDNQQKKSGKGLLSFFKFLSARKEELIPSHSNKLS